jgi:hypothetical protein
MEKEKRKKRRKLAPFLFFPISFILHRVSAALSYYDVIGLSS